MLDFEKQIVELEQKINELQNFMAEKGIDLADEIEVFAKKAEKLKKEVYGNLTPWQRFQIARYPQRPLSLDYINRIFTDFIELHGDRLFRDDPSIIGGIGKLGEFSVTVIAQQKGKDTKENIARNFGMPYPEGYRKAMRLMKQAEKFKRPIICLVDTPGAYPGLDAEERGQGEAIARSMMEMSALEVPIIVVVISEGSSGGALGIGVGNRVLMLENAYYSVISPQGCAAILWKDENRVQDAAGMLKLTAQDLIKLEIIDGIIAEPLGGAHKDYDFTAQNLKEAVLQHLRELAGLSPLELVEQRYGKFRNIGVVAER